MTRALLIILAVAPFAAFGLFVSHSFPDLAFWYLLIGLLTLEFGIRIYNWYLSRDFQWQYELVWMPYHGFLAYLLGSILKLDSLALLLASILLPLMMFCVAWKMPRFSR